MDPMSTTEEDLAAHVEALLGGVVGFEVRREPFGWRMVSRDCEVLVDLVYRELDSDSPPEPALELMRLLKDLGLKGSMGAAEALVALQDGEKRKFTRVMLGAGPGRGRHQWLMLGATLGVADLQVEELRAALGELCEA